MEMMRKCENQARLLRLDQNGSTQTGFEQVPVLYSVPRSFVEVARYNEKEKHT